MPVSESQKKATAKYQKKKYKVCAFKLDREKDKDIIEFLSTVQRKQEFMRNLLRKEMKESKK